MIVKKGGTADPVQSVGRRVFLGDALAVGRSLSLEGHDPQRDFFPSPPIEGFEVGQQVLALHPEHSDLPDRGWCNARAKDVEQAAMAT